MATSRQHSAPAPTNEGLTIIGPQLHVNGRVEGEEDLRIEGRVEGSVSLTETLYIAEGGIVAAKVAARDVVVSGVVVGNVNATNSVTLNPGAKLIGDISTPRLIIADGAAFRGNVAMDGEAPAAAARSTAARPKPRSVLTSRPAAKPAARPTRAPARTESPARVAAIETAEPVEDDVTIVVRHAALAEKAAKAEKAKKATKKKAKKSPPRARVPKPGKRRVGRR
jgi:cytoskeletal protein CcmA (bactofilin family)